MRDPTQKVSPAPDLKTGTDPVAETMCFSVLKNTGRWIKFRNSVILIDIHHLQNSTESVCRNISSVSVTVANVVAAKYIRACATSETERKVRLKAGRGSLGAIAVLSLLEFWLDGRPAGQG